MSPDEHPASLSQQFQRGNLMAAAGLSREVLKHIPSCWGLLVLMVLDICPPHFGALRRALGLLA